MAGLKRVARHASEWQDTNHRRSQWQEEMTCGREVAGKVAGMPASFEQSSQPFEQGCQPPPTEEDHRYKEGLRILRLERQASVHCYSIPYLVPLAAIYDPSRTHRDLTHLYQCVTFERFGHPGLPKTTQNTTTQHYHPTPHYYPTLPNPSTFHSTLPLNTTRRYGRNNWHRILGYTSQKGIHR